MELFRGLHSFPERFRNGVLSIGKFDGVHLGHAVILQRLVFHARQWGIPSVVFTFDPSPVEILNPESAPPLLCTTEQKVELISSFAPDALVVYPTNRAFLEQSPEQFLQENVRNILGSQILVEGENFNFGRNRGGNARFLRQFCEKHSLDFDLILPVQRDGRNISSSLIRALIQKGNVETAGKMLGRPYRFRGKVVDGERRGRLLGFPTANLAQVKTIFPKNGLYAALAHTGQGTFRAAVNLGGNPTFHVQETKIEVHLLDFHDDLYGTWLDVDFLFRVRDIIGFNSQQELLDQINQDLTLIREKTSLTDREG